MPRQARKRSQSGIYHVMFRGIDRQLIFEEKQDYMFLLEILQECKALCNFELYAYCLMGNHVHLLLRVLEDNLETIMKRIAGRYVYWFNIKYKRIGHLLQDRFKSEPVEDDTYFLTVLRYIHQNPVKAKLCKKPGEYSYSSYAAYICEDDLVDTQFAFDILDRKEFIRFHNVQSTDNCLDIVLPTRQAVTDDQAKQIIQKITRCDNIVEFQSLDEKKKTHFIKRIHDRGVSVRQLSRLTGTSKGMVEKWIK